MRHFRFALAIAVALPAVVSAQNTRQVVANPGVPGAVAGGAMAQAGPVTQATPPALAGVRVPVNQVSLRDVTAREAFDWLTNASGIQIVVKWDKLALEGVDPEQRVQLMGTNLTPEAAIEQLIQQIAFEGNLVWEVTPWYVEVMTKTQANANPIIVVYPIGDLMATVPNFTEAPEFDLTAISQQSGGGRGGGGGGGTSLFRDEQEDEIVESELERGGRIADLIRTSIEPDLWRENGGLGGSISYFNKHLIISAPMYVHKQIGGPAIYPASSRAGGAATARPPGAVTNVSSYVNITSGYDRASVAQPIRQVPVHVPVPAAGRQGAAIPGAAAPQRPPVYRRSSNAGITPSIMRVR